MHGNKKISAQSKWENWSRETLGQIEINKGGENNQEELESRDWETNIRKEKKTNDTSWEMHIEIS